MDGWKVGLCNWCGGGVWSDQDSDHVVVAGLVFHRACAERCRDELGDAL